MYKHSTCTSLSSHTLLKFLRFSHLIDIFVQKFTSLQGLSKLIYIFIDRKSTTLLAFPSVIAILLLLRLTVHRSIIHDTRPDWVPLHHTLKFQPQHHFPPNRSAFVHNSSVTTQRSQKFRSSKAHSPNRTNKWYTKQP